MPKHKSAIKRLLQSKERRLRNRARKSHMKAAIKALRIAISDKQGPDKEKVLGLYRAAVSTVAKTSSKGTIHNNTAARKIARLTKAVNKVMGPEWLAAQHPKPKKPKPAPKPKPEVIEKAVVEPVEEALEEVAPEPAAEVAEEPAPEPAEEAEQPEEKEPEVKARAAVAPQAAEPAPEADEADEKEPEEAPEEAPTEEAEEAKPEEAPEPEEKPKKKAPRKKRKKEE